MAEGLRVFERLRDLLREELGTTPSPEALAAHQRLLHPGGRGDGRRTARRGGRSRACRPAIAGAAAGAPRARRRRSSGARRSSRASAWLDGPARRAERVLLLAGDAGVGKTRLLAEIARRAHAAGAIVLAGRAAEEALVPFQPFLEALGHYVSDASPAELRAVTRARTAPSSRA